MKKRFFSLQGDLLTNENTSLELRFVANFWRNIAAGIYTLLQNLEGNEFTASELLTLVCLKPKNFFCYKVGFP